MPLILPGNVALATAAVGYDVANSCRFNDDDSAYMHKTVSYGGATSNQKWTISVWVKRSNSSAAHQIISTGTDSGNQTEIRFEAVGKFQYAENISSSETINVSTNALYRDPSAWYHLVCAVDTTQGTAANRVKLYVNGTLQTSLSTTNYPTEDAGTLINMGVNTGDGVHNIGRRQYNTDQYFDGYMAEFVWIDGLQLAATSFGEFNSDSPTIWQPIDVSGLTFGNNGAYLDFEASGNLGNDANGGTDLTEVNLAAADQATDSPTNNFCTLNPLGNYIGNFSEANQSALAFSEGNNFAGKATHGTYLSTMATDKMKFYFEMKPTDTNTYMGIIDISTISTSVTHSYEDATANSYYPYGNRVWVAGSNSAAGGFDNTQNQIYMFAVDPANNKMWYGRGGTWVGDPAAGSSETWDSLPANTLWTPWVNPNATTQENDTACNFGGCSAFDISSANQDANGYGNFEYAVPSGFLALCTKNLGSDGG